MQAWLTRAYERNVRGYLLSVIGAAYASAVLVTAPVCFIVPARFLGLSLGQYGIGLIVCEAATVAVLATGTGGARRELRVIVRWLDSGAAAEGVPDAARALQAAPPRAIAAAGYALPTIAIPATVAIVGVLARHMGLAGGVALALGVTLTYIYGAVLVWFWLEISARPAFAHAARLAPEANRTHSTTFPLAIRLLVGVLAAAILSGALSAPFVARFDAGGVAYLKALLIAIAVAATFGLTLLVIVALGVLEPIRDLIGGTQAVRDGELDVRVPVTSADELGALAESFNEMVDGLRERERLREDNAKLVFELRSSRERIVAAADAERRRLERDLHDGAQQHLVLMGLKLGLAKRMASRDAAATEQAIDELRHDLGRALADLRSLAHGIYPALLLSEGLPGALRAAATNMAIRSELDCNGARRYPPEIEFAVYFCCLEALQNAAKHAGDGATARVMLAALDQSLRFQVADDGCGFEPSTVESSAGLQNMTDRIGALGGELTITSTPGHGTTVAGAIPLGH
jgi:signal transduction histidine kinase